MKLIRVVSGFLVAAMSMLVAGCSSGQTSTDTITRGYPVDITRPSEVTLTVRTDPDFTGKVIVTLDSISVSSPVKSKRTLDAAHPTAQLSRIITLPGETLVTVTVKGVGTDGVTIDPPDIKLMR